MLLKSKRVKLLVVVLITFLHSCTLEKAKPFNDQLLVVASDCLHPEDSVLFARFEKTNKIDIKLMYFPSDSLFTKLRKEGLNTQIDAVILHSAYNIDKYDQQKLLHAVPVKNIPTNYPLKHATSKRTWFSLGYDPYIIVSQNDTLGKASSYKDLTNKVAWCSNLKTKETWIPFFAGIVQRMNSNAKYNAHDWISNFLKKNTPFSYRKDSLTTSHILLTSYSDFKTNKLFKKSKFANKRILFPNQRSGGSYYNSVNFGIVRQARNYLNALKFLEYLSTEKTNQRLNNHWKTFPLINETESPYAYQNLRFKKYFYSTALLSRYFYRVDKVLSSIKDSHKIY